MVQVTQFQPLDLAGLALRTKAVKQRDRTLDVAEDRNAILADQKDRTLAQAEDRNNLVKSREELKLGMAVMAVPSYERFEQLKPLIERSPVFSDGFRQELLALDANSFVEQQAQLSAEMHGFRELIADLSPEEQQLATRIKAGVAPRAVGNAESTIASGQAGVTAEEVGEVAGTISASEKASDQAIEISGEMFEQIQSVGSSISNIDQAVAAIDDGASSGVIENRFPSIRQSSVELENIGRRMGLDIVAQGKFGPLSEGELSLALATALPPLQPEALKEWLTAKKSAQQRLLGELNKAAKFLSKPGNTLNGFLEMQEVFSDQPETPPEADLSSMSDEELKAILKNAN